MRGGAPCVQRPDLLVAHNIAREAHSLSPTPIYILVAPPQLFFALAYPEPRSAALCLHSNVALFSAANRLQRV